MIYWIYKYKTKSIKFCVEFENAGFGFEYAIYLRFFVKIISNNYFQNFHLF